MGEATRQVFLHDMVLPARIGVHAHEHGRAQRVRINVDLTVADPGGEGGDGVGPDELGRVVDYEALASRVRAIVSTGHVKLAETLAERLAMACLADGRVVLARIRVEKLDVFDDVAAAGVEVVRYRR